MNLICPSCKTENPSIAIFCSNCGYNLKQFKELSDLELLQESLSAKDYKVERQIDGGTQSDPFLCEYIPTGEKFVVRLFKKDQPEDLKDIFITGVNLNARLDHPNILIVKEVGMLGDRPYFISKYADNGTLSWLLNTYGTKGMPIEEAIDFTIKILKKMESLSSANLD